jgi:hypothetical protein
VVANAEIYLTEIAKQNKLNPPDKENEFGLLDGPKAFDYCGREHKQFPQLVSVVETAVKALQTEDLKASVPGLLTLLKEDVDAFRQAVCYEGEWFRKPIFSFINPQECFDALSTLSNTGLLSFEHGLLKRYQFVQTFRSQLDELPFLQALNDLVANRIESDLKENDGLMTPKTNAFERVHRQLGSTIKLLNQNLVNQADLTETEQGAGEDNVLE